jgi:SAM-dependent methyltransferase
LGAGAGRNTLRYTGFERIVLVDYSRSQLRQAQERLGASDRYVFVAADIYRLPFVEGIFDAATMIRTLHHMADAPAALAQVRFALAPRATFILEFANKLNLKAIVRYWLGLQSWDPFGLEPVEFARLNFDFHPRAVRTWLNGLGFHVEKVLTVSHFRSAFLKRVIPTNVLVRLDAMFQPTGGLWELTPSVFLQAVLPGLPQVLEIKNPAALFRCPECGQSPLLETAETMECLGCGRRWEKRDGIYDFRRPLGAA